MGKPVALQRKSHAMVLIGGYRSEKPNQGQLLWKSRGISKLAFGLVSSGNSQSVTSTFHPGAGDHYRLLSLCFAI
jgi:hypothetical protein